MPTRRDKSEIIKDILLEAREKSTKTRILHRANMNLAVFPTYLKALEDRSYIERFKTQKNQTFYRTTEKGKDLLKKMNEIHQLLKNIRKK